MAMQRKRGWTVSATPMATLFEGAVGALRSVKLNAAGEEDEDGTLMHCVYDAIQYVCEVKKGRASSIWIDNVSDNTKLILGFKEYIFRQRKIAVVHLEGLMTLINRLNSGNAVNFRARFGVIVSRYVRGDTTMCDEITINQARGVEASLSVFMSECKADALVLNQKFHEQAGYVYGMQNNYALDHIKVGFTTNLAKRLSNANVFSALSPFSYVTTIKTLDARSAETRVHEYLADFRGAGEFFKITKDQLLEAFAHCVQETDVDIEDSEMELD